MGERQLAARHLWFLLIVVIVGGCTLVEGDADMGGAPPENSASGTVIITVESEPAGQAGAFQFTGVPTGTVSTDGTLVVADLQPGTYTTTQVDPAPDFDLTAVRCDDEDSTTASLGDPQTRTAVLNVDPGETVTCTFTNTQRGAAVLVSQTVPEGAVGSFRFTGVPTGTVPTNGTLVVANLRPGTYSSTVSDPAPEFDTVAVSCDDGNSATPSSGDSQTRTAIFNLDPGEMVQCTFTYARRGTVIAVAEVNSEIADGSFQYTGVPTGTIPVGGELVVEHLPPGTYTTTEVDPAPNFDLVDVACNDSESATVSRGDAATRTAIYNLDAGETVRCIFSHEIPTGTIASELNPGLPAGESEDGLDPFENPDRDLTDFPLPDELPADAGSYTVPKAGPWSVTHFAGQMDCGVTSLAIPASPPESGVVEVLDGGQTVVGRSLQADETVPITLSADPGTIGRYTGAVDGTEQGVPVTLTYVWQVVTEEYVVGYLTASLTSEGVTCTVYRPYELSYTGSE